MEGYPRYIQRDTYGRTVTIHHTEYTPHDAIDTKANREVYTRMETNGGIHTEGHMPTKIYEG